MFAAVFGVVVSLLTLMILVGPPSLSNHFRGTSVRNLFIPSTNTNAGTLLEHPIKRLVRDAEAKFEELVARQSKSFDKAASVYFQRYQRRPPPGFELWLEFATRHDSVIIDDFDVINEYPAPFWSLSGVEVKSRLDNVRRSGPAIWHCQSVGG